MIKMNSLFLSCAFSILSILPSLYSRDFIKNPELDKKVQAFLDNNKGKWHDLNVPASDGKLLYDLIIKGGYTRALEIGTSTGRSGVWIAWALSKTGGKLITIDIDKDRRAVALQNFEKAGLSDYVDSRLADAHQLVKELQGPFDFVFSDADKDWYKQYFIDVDPKLVVGGCFTAHNLAMRRNSGIREFKDYIQSLPNYETTIDFSGGGLSISYKKAEK